MITLVTSTQFARMIGCSQSALYKAIKIGSHNIPCHTAKITKNENTIIKLWNVDIAQKYVDTNEYSKPKPRKVPKEEVKALYSQGFRVSDIVAKTGVSPNTIRKIAIDNNMERVKKLSFHPPAHKIDKILSRMAITRAVVG